MILDDSLTAGVELGSFVIVEADRGEDLGIVVFIAARDSSLALSLHAASNSVRAGSENTLKKILRLASLHEKADLPRKAKDEMDILSVSSVISAFLCYHDMLSTAILSFLLTNENHLLILDLSRNGSRKISTINFTRRCRIPI